MSNTTSNHSRPIEQWLSPEEIDKYTGELALALDSHIHANKLTDPMLIGVLPEGLFVTADVALKTNTRKRMGFVVISNLNHGPRAHLLRERGSFPDVAGADALFLHCRVKSGNTIRHLNRVSTALGASSVAHFALLHQPPRSGSVDVTIAATTVRIGDPDRAVFGFGIPQPCEPGQWPPTRPSPNDALYIFAQQAQEHNI